MIFSDYFFSTKNYQNNWTFCWFFEILSQYMCISKTSSKKIAFRTSRIYWKITKILKTLSDNKPRVILYLYPYLFSQYSVTLFRFCAVPMVIFIIDTFLQLSDDCLLTAWWLPDDCLMTAWWLPDDSLTIARQLPDYCLISAWQQPDDCLMTALWLHYDCLMTAWQLHTVNLWTIA